MESFSRDGLQLAYEVYGDPSDRPFLLLHGLGADHAMWKPQIERYPGDGYYLIAPDVRGHGGSESVPQFTIDDCAADLAELLLERDVPSAAVCGVSMGGVIAQQLAIDYPDLVRAFVLADTFSSVRSPVARLNARAGEIGLSLLPGLLQWKSWSRTSTRPSRRNFRSTSAPCCFGPIPPN
ncbi:MAG: alpha/beta fold hydrolase [Halovenus sp.]